MMDKDSKQVVIKKRPIDKKKLTVIKKAKKVKEKEVVEIPVSKLIMAVAILAVVAIVIFAGLKLIKPKEEEDVAAIVNGEVITWNEIDGQYNKLSPQLQQLITKDVLLNQTINEKLLMNEIKEKEIVVDEEELNALVERVKSQFTEEQLNETLEAQGLTMDEFVEQLSNRLKINNLLSGEIPELMVNDSEIKAFFNENKESLATPEMVRASHILVNSSEEAETLLAMLRNGSDFSELAASYSLDGTAQNGGDLGYFARGTMVPAFEEAAFNLEVGEISGVVKTDYGYHIIKLTDRKAAKNANLEELRALIKFNLFDSKLNANPDKFQEYMQGLREKSEIEIFERK